MSMSSGERSPKRQRLEGSYSPASPLPTFDTKPVVIPPQTPPPSVRMSPSWSTQSLTAGQQQTSVGDEVVEMQRDDRRHGDGDGDRDGDGDAEMRDVQAVDAEHRRTDHERQGGEGSGGRSRGGDPDPDTAAPLTASALTSKAKPTATAPGAGVLYRLRTAPVMPSKPHPTQDLIQLYDLKRIQASVARRDPVTGEKINVMRKSYANKVKALVLEGRNKAESNLHELEGLLDPGWGQLVDGTKTLWQQSWESRNLVLGNADHENVLLSKLDAALKMEPGRLPGKLHEHYKGMLGLEEAAAVAVKGPASKPLPGAALARTAPAIPARNSAPASPRSAIRPDRSGKKRRYNDSSFEGYDQDDDGALSAVDDTGRRVSGSKRQKRKDFSPNPMNSASGGGGGMVGVRSS